MSACHIVATPAPRPPSRWARACAGGGKGKRARGVTFLPSFLWGGAGGVQTYRMDKALATARRVMERRGETLSGAHEGVFRAVFAASEDYRR